MALWWAGFLLACTGRDVPAGDDSAVTETVDTIADTPFVPPDPPDDSAGILFDSDPGADGSWAHTLRVDGQLWDWYATEQLSAVHDGARAYASWDEAYLYLALSEPTLGQGSEGRWLAVFIGNGSGGTPDAPDLSGQAPVLPFGAVRVVHWRSDGQADTVYYFLDGAWDPRPHTLGTGGSSVAVDRGSGVVEITVSRGAYQIVGTTIDLAWAWVDTDPSTAQTWGAVPNTGFVPGFDAPILSWYRFRTDAPDGPASYSPMVAP